MKVSFSAIKYPLLFSAIITLLLIVFYPFSFHESHRFELLKEYGGLSFYEYHDMNNDGDAEVIHIGYNRLTDNTLPFVRLGHGIDSRVELLEQINFINNKLPWRACVMYGDYNHNGLEELYTFTLADTTLFLEAFEYDSIPERIKLFAYKKLCEINRYKDKMDVNIPLKYELIDLNHDGFSELIFLINGLYTAEPRGIYAYDIKNDSLWQTSTQSIQYIDFSFLEFEEKTYFSAYTGTVHNSKEPLVQYHDHCGWALLFDEKLNMIMDPVPSKHGYHYDVVGYPVIYKGSLHLLGIFISPQNSNDSTKIRIYNTDGHTVEEYSMGVNGRFLFKEQGMNNDSIILTQSGSSWLCTLADKLDVELLKSVDQEYTSLEYISPVVIAGKEFAIRWLGEKQKIVLLRANRNIAELNFPDQMGHYQISYGSYNSRHGLLISNFYKTHFAEIVSNPGYEYRYLYWFLFFLVLFIFFSVMRLVFTFQIKRQQTIRAELIRGQLAISRKQLEPHFMLNILNNIGYMFAKEDTKQGQYYFGKYASLLHHGLKYADQTETSLEVELKFIQDYLDLQKMRLDDGLNYHIDIAENVHPELINIPHSLVYTFTENAIKHGLTLKEGQKNLWVIVSERDKKVEIVIRDNGIGREMSKRLQTSGTGKGLGIVQDIVSAYNKLYNRSITFNIIDLEEGTEVIIRVI